MVERLFLAAGLTVAAAAVAAVLRRRTPTIAPTQPVRDRVPSQLDRDDFPRPDVPWLVAVFTSDTCLSCNEMKDKAKVLACADVAYEEVSWQRHRSLHERYQIDGVPLLLLADRHGVVTASFIGRVSATDLWAAVAEARQPGSSPEPDLGH
jgi:hypothetical protein